MVKIKNSVYAKILIIMLVIASFSIGRLSIQMKTVRDGNKVGEEETNSGAETTVNESKIAVSELKKMAKTLKLDVKKFNECLEGGIFAEKVASESAEGMSYGVQATPTFFINGIMVVGNLPLSDFEAIIDAELKDGTGDKVKTSSDDPPRKDLNIPYGFGYINGSKNAKIKIMEYTDFECPSSGRALPTIQALLSKYGEDISLEYRSALAPFHKNAQKAAEAAHCAGEQGKFWEMHDKIFMEMTPVTTN